jgi:hypothetical protein
MWMGFTVLIMNRNSTNCIAKWGCNAIVNIFYRPRSL